MRLVGSNGGRAEVAERWGVCTPQKHLPDHLEAVVGLNGCYPEEGT